MDNKKSTPVPAQGKTIVLATNQFQCERLIRAGRTVADIAHTELVVLNVESSEYPPNPQAIQHLFNISRDNDAVMNVMYSEDTYKTIVKYIKENHTNSVVTGMPSTPNSVLHRLWKKFARVNFFTVDAAGNLDEVADRTVYRAPAPSPADR